MPPSCQVQVLFLSCKWERPLRGKYNRLMHRNRCLRASEEQFVTDVRELTREDFERLVAEAGLMVPIEQTMAWADYQDTIPGRTFWACLALVRDGADVAYVTFTDYETHGYHYLRAHHGPMWVQPPTEEQEHEAMQALVAYVRKRDRRQAFMRLAVDHELAESFPTLSSIPYDTTVLVDLRGGDEKILNNMKARGRRDVRKALREAQLDCADETERALASFDEYYEVMVETAERDGFTPAPKSDYEDMIKILGPERCRVFAGRMEDGSVGTWSICTMSGTLATYYYAASRGEARRSNVTDKLFYFACCELGRHGCEVFDLMGIGSDFSPTLKSLNTFKTKFAKDVTHVAPDRDIAIKGGFYKSLIVGKRVIQAVRNRG